MTKKCCNKEEVAKLKELCNFKNSEVNILQSKLERAEMENSLLRKCSTLDRSNRIASRNFIKSSPESSMGDKSGSELSKKLVSKGNLIFEKEYLGRTGQLPGSFPDSRCKTVGSPVQLEDDSRPGQSQQQGKRQVPKDAQAGQRVGEEKQRVAGPQPGQPDQDS